MLLSRVKKRLFHHQLLDTLSIIIKMPKHTEDPCWTHVIRTHYPGRNHPEIKCQYCSASWSSREKERCINHLSKCPALPDHLKDVYQSDKASGKKRKRDWADSMMADEQSAAEASCARWIYAAALPLSTTEHPAFKEFMRVLRPSFKTPSRYLIGHTLLQKEYESLGDKVNKALEQSQRISLITDGWSNPRNESIINYLAATEGNVLFIRSVNTTVDRHTGQYLADELCEVVDELGSEKVIALTTDNATNMKSSWQKLKQVKPKIITIGCCSHHLNLLANDVISLPGVAEVWQQILSVAKWFKRHGVAAAIVRALAQQTAPFVAFQVPGKTRWQGKLYTVRALNKNQAAIQRAVFDPNIISANAKPDERTTFNQVKELVNDGNFWHQSILLEQLLEPLLKVTLALESDSPKLSHVYANIAWLVQKATFNSLVPTEVIKPVLSKRFLQAYHPLMGIAYLADPQARIKYPVAVTANQMNNISSWLLNEWCESDPILAGKLYGQLQNLQARTGPFADEVKWYASAVQSPIDWWRNYLDDEPELTSLCLIALSITPTAGAAERNWSSHGLIHSLKRNRLDHDTVVKLVFLHWNLRINLKEQVPEEDVEVAYDIDLDDDEAYRPDYMCNIDR